MVARHVLVSGRVQGVFYRATCVEKAYRHQVSGWVRNLADGRVEAWFEGDDVSVQALVDWCSAGPPRAHVESVEVEDVVPQGFGTFETR
ncbi:MAG: acylphosphatase [Actinomycetales bacterium]|nr:MAG: acylphosphatase [Actinomycetales bacterium]